MRVNRVRPSPVSIATDPVGLEQFAAERGLPLDFLGEQGLHIVADISHPMQGWLAFPYPHVTGIWKHRYKNMTPLGLPKYLDEDGADVHLYNPQRLGPNVDALVLTEGEMDTLVLTYLGFPAVGVSGTQAFRPAWKLLFQHALVVIAFDADKAGDEAAARALDEFAPRSARLRPPEGMDINDWYLDDRDQLTRAVHAALSTE